MYKYLCDIHNGYFHKYLCIKAIIRFYFLCADSPSSNAICYNREVEPNNEL